jgi:Lrp/AsnC family transcriptional regulator for asnA, asnC and gidA
LDNQLDKLDRAILDYLMKDARTPYLQIAQLCGVSGATVHLRVQKLEKQGLIQGSRLLVDYKKLGLGVRAFLGIYLDKSGGFDNIFKRLEEIPEVLECHFTTGTYSMFLKVLCRDTDHLRDLLLEKIQNLPNVRRTETFISLQETVNKEPGLEMLFGKKEDQ